MPSLSSFCYLIISFFNTRFYPPCYCFAMFIFCKVRTICFRLVHRKSKGVVITNSAVFLIQWSNQILYKAKINQLTRKHNNEA